MNSTLKTIFILLASLAISLVSCQIGETADQLKLVSSSFDPGDPIPQVFSCDGSDISPPLSWSNVPEGTQSFALICDDPDAPVGTWVHWVVYNIPADSRLLHENQPRSRELASGAIQGTNSWGKLGYGGPCPPSGKHRYYFKLYALSEALSLQPGATKDDLLVAMDGLILSETQLKGTYRRK